MWWFWFLGWFFIIVIVIGNGIVICLIIGICCLYNIVNWLVFVFVFVDLFVGFMFFFLFFVMKIDSLNDFDYENVDLFFLVFRIFFYFLVINLFVMIVD